MAKLRLRIVGDHASLTQTGKGKRLRRPFGGRRPRPAGGGRKPKGKPKPTRKPKPSKK